MTQDNLTLVKAHAFGNDFLLVNADAVRAVGDEPAFARMVCDRHRGIGADGLMVFEPHEDRVAMRLLNADGSPSEISGNGVRCLAAWIARTSSLTAGAIVNVETEAGLKPLELLDVGDDRYTFRAAMGHPEQIAREMIDVNGEAVDAITLRVGNPQCVLLGEVTEERLHRVASQVAVHPRFPAGTNVELAAVEAPDRVRILIWERGVGPTEASGTGACAAAVAAMHAGGASRDVQVVSPGGTQRVEWREDGLYLTGWAEIVAHCRWLKTTAR
jgi:diaminopimelate epimerase